MKNVFVVLALVALWVLGGLVVGISFQALFGVQWMVQCAALNLIVGMVMLLLVTNNEDARRLFYEGPRGDEISSPLIGMLWALPIVLFLVGLAWWVLAQFLE